MPYDNKNPYHALKKINPGHVMPIVPDMLSITGPVISNTTK